MSRMCPMGKKYYPKLILVFVLICVQLTGCTMFSKSTLYDTRNTNLYDSDFEILYSGERLTVNENANLLFAKLGESNFKINDKLSKSTEKFRFERYDCLLKDLPISLVIRRDIKNNTSFINQIDMGKIGTERGIREGDSIKKITKLYGDPNDKGDTKNGVLGNWYTYKLGEKSLVFFYNDKKIISNISICDNSKK